MKTHHFYYLTIAITAVVASLMTYLLISDAIMLKDVFSKEEDKISSVTNSAPQDEYTPQVNKEILNDTTVYVKGIDVSKYQKEIDWSAMPEKIQFIFCRATEGRTLIDSEFSENWQNSKASGIIRGAYHFYRSDDDPIVQAQFFWKIVGSVEETDLPLVLDIEMGSLAGTVVRSDLTSDLLSFLKEIERLSGKKPMVYSNLYFANQYLSDPRFSEYPLWMAEYRQSYPTNVPNAWKDKGWQFWQQSDTYDLEAANGDVDFDIFKGNLQDLKSFARATSEENS